MKPLVVWSSTRWSRLHALGASSRFSWLKNIRGSYDRRTIDQHRQPSRLPTPRIPSSNGVVTPNHRHLEHKKKEKWVFSSLPRRGTTAATAHEAAEHERLTCNCSAGYALFKSKDKKLLSKGDELSKDVSTVVESLKLKKFTKFESAVTALNEAAALTDGKVSSMLGNLLQELKDETKASCTPFAT